MKDFFLFIQIHSKGQSSFFKCPSCAKPYISESWYQKHAVQYRSGIRCIHNTSHRCL